MDPADSSKLNELIALLQAKPGLVHSPQLATFKKYLQSIGATLPPESESTAESAAPKPNESKAEKKDENVPEADAESEPESEVDLDTTGVIETDEDLLLEMGDSSKEASETDVDKSNELRVEAQKALAEQKLDESLKLWTEAIKLNSQSAVFFAKRAQCLLKLNKPLNAIKDCSKAIELNPDQALAYRLRGRAHRLLGDWEKAALDLNTSLKIDFNEEADEWLKEVAPNAKKLHDHKRKYERKREEKELRERRERLRRAQEERQKQPEFSVPDFDGIPEGMPGFGGPPGGEPNAGGMFAEWMKDPEIREALSDPEVAAALQDMSRDPSNMMKSQSNPKVLAAMAKIAAKMGFKPNH